MEAVKTIQGRSKIVIALAGNPNSGKTTMFNELTGARQHVGNWPGVTVEKKEGMYHYQDFQVQVVDLPGTYSLSAYSEDEAVARDYIALEKPDVVVNIVDAANLDRNLYLTTQLIEMGANVVVALNMYDEAQKRNIEINIDQLAELLGVPVIPTISVKGKGLQELSQQISLSANNPNKSRIRIDYGKEIEKVLGEIQDKVSICEGGENYDSRWLAVKMLEGDEGITKSVQLPDELIKMRNNAVQKLEAMWGDDIESVMAERRYGFIGGVTREVVTRHRSVEEKMSLSDKIDGIVTNRFLGIPIFLAAMWVVFQFTFTLGDPMIGWIEGLFEWLGGLFGTGLEHIGVSEMIISLVVDGVINGIGSVLVFVPNIFLLFFAISILEDSGYMARAAYIMDRFMHSLGLHGKSFIPMIIGFGCSVPAIMATRTLENKKDRMITILIAPLMSCSARLPVYILFVSAFFSANQGLVIFSLYFLGIVLAIIMGVLFKKFLFKGETSHFVMELPPYRIPTLKSTIIHMWERGSSYIRKAGTIIFAVVVLIWVLSSLPAGVEYASQGSWLGQIGSFMAPIFKPAGFGTWEASAALVFGILAKEVVVATLAVIHSVGEEALTQVIANTWTPLAAYAFMVMTLIYIPCAAAIGAIKKETNSWGWAGFAVLYTLILGWLMAVLVYQGGSLLGL